jgi:hypothetical protein
MGYENVFKFNFWEGGGGVRGGVEKKEEEELKEQIDMKVSTKFQINPSTGVPVQRLDFLLG